MVKLGVFKHYKSTVALYRVLFTAKWENGGAPAADEPLDVYAIGASEEPALRVSCQTNDFLHPDVLITHARWSGNTPDVVDGTDIVIYGVQVHQPDKHGRFNRAEDDLSP